MKTPWIYLMIMLSLFSTSCGVIPASSLNNTDAAASSSAEVLDDPAHSNDTDPDYDTVFPDGVVNRLDIVISPENWALMQADMTALYGEPGTGSRMEQRPAGDAPQERGMNPPDGAADRPADMLPPNDRQAPARGGGPGTAENDQNPIWVEATVLFNGEIWEHVGVRYKGNSTLRTAWSNGSLALPFKLDFDQFEDDYPETEDQRFYGFKQLTLANNVMDGSYLREVTASEVFDNAGLVIAESALYEVFLDYGEGPQYLGLYTMVEVVEDTVIDTAFGDDDGAIYKAEGSAASFAEGTRSQVEHSFDLENDVEDAWIDLQELYDVLHASLRTEDPAAWRAELESIFNVETFLNWLAVNTLTQDWDTYGNMTHNYYLYHNPETGLLEWISWDKSWAFSGDGGIRPALSLNLDEVSEDWPLIRYLMDDPAYAAMYAAYLGEALETAFNPDIMTAWYEEMAALVRPYLEEGPETDLFERTLRQLMTQAEDRYQAALDYLAE